MMEAEAQNTTNPNKNTHAIAVDMASLSRPQQKRSCTGENPAGATWRTLDEIAFLAGSSFI